MSAVTLRRRAGRLEARAADRAIERTLRRIAAELDIAPEVLRAEAVALHQQFAEAGIGSEEAKLALVARELNLPLEELRREVAAVLAAC